MNKVEPDRSQRKALGKGLSTLLPGKNGAAARLETQRSSQGTEPKIKGLPEHFEVFESIEIDRISPGAAQPRTNFEADKLDELAQSIRVHGILQPITVRRGEDGRFRIVAGERRWRAAKLAGLTEIPSLVRTVAEDKLLELALIENIQREDLNPIETAVAYSRLIEQHSLSHEEVAERTGKDRSTVTNFLRLLKLAREVQDDLVRGDLSMGHARTLLGLPTHAAQRAAAQQILDRGLSVRDTERLVKTLARPKPEAPAPAKAAEATIDPNVRAAIDELQAALGTKVRLVQRSPQAGRLEIEYYSQDDLDRIYAHIIRD